MSEFDPKKKREELNESLKKLLAELKESEAKTTEISSNVLRLQGAIAVLNEQIGEPENIPEGEVKK